MKKLMIFFNQEMKEGREVEKSDAEILDELTTSRGELKVRTVSLSEDRSSQVIQDSNSYVCCHLRNKKLT